ncbi:MAG: HEAT repeat domain-containing protein [Verrucomicrobiota bacterium]
MKFRLFCASGLLLTVLSAAAETRLLQAFEGDGFGDWKVEGKGFGLAPVTGDFDGLTAALTGYANDALACSAHGGDSGIGSLLSPDFKLTENFIAFLIAGGNHPGKAGVRLVVDGKPAMEATGKNSLQCQPVIWDVSALRGKTAHIEIFDTVTGSWGVIAADHFILTDSANPEFPKTTHGGLASLVASEAIPGLTHPEGTRAKVIADHAHQQITSPTALTFGEQGEIYVAETHRFRHGVPDNRDHLYWYIDDISSRTTADRMKMYEKWQHKAPNTSLQFLTEKQDLVRQLSQPNSEGVYQKSTVFAGNFNDALDGPAAGVFAYEGSVFLSCIPNIYALRDKDGDGQAEERTVTQDGFGVRVSFSGHDLNGFVLGPDGRLYGTLGDRGLNLTTREGVHYEMPDEGCVFRFDPDGSNFEIIHRGLRNPKEIAFDEFGNGISVDNNCDQGDKARVVYIVDGADTGWNMGHQGLLVHHNQMGMSERPPAAWMAERMWEMPNPEQPAYIVPPVGHITSGPSGLTYHPGTGFIAEEAGRFLVCDYRGGAASSGIWSFKTEPSGAGMKMTGARKLNWGAAVTDVEYSWDGKLAVTDFIGGWASHEGGRVYSLEAEKTYLAEEARQVATLVREGFENRTTNDLAQLLHHPDMRVRLRAQLALTRKQDGFQALQDAATQSAQPLARRHGIWGLGVIARRASAVLPGITEVPPADEKLRKNAFTVLASLLGEKDAEVRAQAVKAIGESGLSVENFSLSSLIRDASPRVQLFAALAAGRLRLTAAVPDILAMLEATEDPYLRHAGSHALFQLQTAAELAKLKDHASPRVRMAAVIALRTGKSPELAAFLNDRETRVAQEAIRAINDADIVAVRSQVGALLDQAATTKHPVMIWRRMLHSAFRAGDETSARRVLATALDTRVPQATREEAFRLLIEWTTPSPVDQSTGRMGSPLPERDPALMRNVLSGSITPLVQVDGKFLASALTLIQSNKLDLASVSDAVLRSLVLQEAVPGPARVEALHLYSARKPADLAEMLATLAAGKDDDLAIGALASLVESTPDSALDGLAKATASGSPQRQQEAWKLAAKIDSPAAAKLIVTGLDGLKKANGISPAALELLNAAASRNESEVKSALASFQSSQAASTDALAAYLPSLEGGNPEQGGKLFESHPAGQCMRCHASGHGGGDAGPNLSGVGLRGDRRFFLEAIVNPGAKVAMGYGIASVTLKGGKNVAGIVIADTPAHVDLDSSGKVLRVSRGDIDSMTPPISAMPPMGAMLSPIEMRDLVAWLAEQKHDTREEKKRPAPETVTP